jgi:hypothetical protein
LREHWWPALSISPGAGSPCQPASLLGTRHPDSSGWRTVREGGPAWWGARPVELSVPERAWRYHWGTRQGSAPTHPGSFRQSPLLGGEHTLSPGFVRVLCPHEGDRQCSRGSAREPGGAQPYREFCPPVCRRAHMAGPYGPLPFWRWVPCPCEGAGDPLGEWRGGVSRELRRCSTSISVGPACAPLVSTL